MSSYLTFYVKLKNVEKPAPIMSWSRSTKMYQALDTYVTYLGMGDEWQFTDLTEKIFDQAIEDLLEEKKGFKKYLDEYEKHAGENETYINYIVEYKEEVEGCDNAIEELKFYKSLVQEIQHNGYCEDSDVPLHSVEKYMANID